MSRCINESLNTAFASARMEGFDITPAVEANCRLLVSGELSIQDYLHRMTEVSTPDNRSVENVL